MTKHCVTIDGNEAGVDGLVLFNRFYQPDINPHEPLAQSGSTRVRARSLRPNSPVVGPMNARACLLAVVIGLCTDRCCAGPEPAGRRMECGT